MLYDELIQIPEYLFADPDSAISLAASSCATFCEIACETEAMLCGECSGQSCSGQCAASECSQSCREACKAGLSCSECYSSSQCSQSCGEVCVTYESCYQSCSESTPVRPGNWTWTSTIASGREIRITASEWNGFCARINEFRTYKGLSNYSFTTAVSGTTKISAAIVNQARTAISAISGHGTLPNSVIVGESLAASFFVSLSSALNVIT